MPKIIKDGPDAIAGIAVGTNNLRVHGKKENYINFNEQGITISGPMSFVAGLGQIRTGALWTFNNEMLLSIPSTLATPTPVVIINPPIKQLKDLMAGTALMLGIIGG